MSCYKTGLGQCSSCGAWWKEMRKSPLNHERCANCNETVVIPPFEFSEEQQGLESRMRAMGFVRTYPPQGNTCSKCHGQFGERGICPCGIDIRTGRPFGM